MSVNQRRLSFFQAVCLFLVAGATPVSTFAEISAESSVGDFVLKPGHSSLQSFQLPDPPEPEDNLTSPARVELGKQLFFDPRLSGDGNMSCASCHNPLFGWSDGLPTGRGFQSQILGRATPTIVNTAYNSIQMWDGRKKSLEDQAMGPLEADVEMNLDPAMMVAWLKTNDSYVNAFAEAYPGEVLSAELVSKAIAAFERTIVSRNSAFDRWVAGDAGALSSAQVRGFEIFLDPEQGNCAACHMGANFTDNGFHNLGLASHGAADPDPGRYAQVALGIMKGAFKTPTLRDVSLTAPYFHDGSARTLMEVVEHYQTGGVVRTHLSPNMKTLSLSQQDKEDLVAFMQALTTPPQAFVLPTLPVPEQPVAWAAWQPESANELAAK